MYSEERVSISSPRRYLQTVAMGPKESAMTGRIMDLRRAAVLPVALKSSGKSSQR